MITYKIEDDGDISFTLPGGTANVMDPGVDGDRVTFLPEEIAELEMAISSAKFDWCKKFKRNYFGRL